MTECVIRQSKHVFSYGDIDLLSSESQVIIYTLINQNHEIYMYSSLVTVLIHISRNLEFVALLSVQRKTKLILANGDFKLPLNWK